MTLPLSKLNLKNTDSKQFKDCADLFLDCVEQKLDVKFNHRQRTRDILVELLAFYCLPNPEREVSKKRVEIKVTRRRR